MLPCRCEPLPNDFVAKSIVAPAILFAALIIVGAPDRVVGGETTYYSAAKVAALREEARGLMTVPRDGPDGWSKSSVEPAQVLRAFPALTLREGFALRAYEFKAGGNGNGVVWALPADARFPDPKDCATLDDSRKTPKPLDALDDVMEAVAGSDTPDAYLQASLLRRQLKEFGAIWHGLSWSTHHVVEIDPAAAPRTENGDPMRNPRTAPKDWKWHEPRPADWRPRVTLETDRAIVTFYTFTGYRRETITRHVDEYRRGKFRARVEETKIAEGRSGFVF